jgi:hypothetical protein
MVSKKKMKLESGLKVYMCSIYDEGWMTSTLEQRDIILARSEEEARMTICARWQVRKNKKGLKIEEIPFVKAKRVAKTQEELIRSTDYRPGLGHWDDSHYGKVTRYYCSKCGKEIVTLADFCKHCGSYLG